LFDWLTYHLLRLLFVELLHSSLAMRDSFTNRPTHFDVRFSIFDFRIHTNCRRHFLHWGGFQYFALGLNLLRRIFCRLSHSEAIPWPPPIQREETPYFLPRQRSLYIKVKDTLTPLALSGWLMALRFYLS